MTFPASVEKIFRDYEQHEVTGRIEFEYQRGNLVIVRPQIPGLEVERVQGQGGRLSFLERIQ